MLTLGLACFIVAIIAAAFGFTGGSWVFAALFAAALLADLFRNLQHVTHVGEQHVDQEDE